MARLARVVVPEYPYHVIQRGNRRQNVFFQPQDKAEYLKILNLQAKFFRLNIWAYCLMTNHIHLLVKTSEFGSISKIMQSITVAHTRRYNFKYRRCGHVWQGRFNSPLVSEDDHMLTIMQYIEQNPLRAKMVKTIAEYPWSSYKLNVQRIEPILIDREENKVFRNLGGELNERIYNYKKKMAEEIAVKELDRIHGSTRKDGHYLSEKFKDQIAALLPRKRGRGRPRSRELCCK